MRVHPCPSAAHACTHTVRLHDTQSTLALTISTRMIRSACLRSQGKLYEWTRMHLRTHACMCTCALAYSCCIQCTLALTLTTRVSGQGCACTCTCNQVVRASSHKHSIPVFMCCAYGSKRVARCKKPCVCAFIHRVAPQLPHRQQCTSPSSIVSAATLSPLDCGTPG